MDSIPEDVRRLFRTSHDIPAQWHIDIQAAFQRHTENAVSKTVNFPAQATMEEVKSAYLKAFESGCKGVTIYRYGSRDHQVLVIGKEEREPGRILPRPRPRQTRGVTERIRTGCGKLYVTINADEDGVCEVFAQMGKTGGCASSQIEAAGRLISLALRSGVKPEAIIKQLIGIRCPSPSWENGKMVLSCPDAISQVLKVVTDAPLEADPPAMGGVCAECGGTLSHEEGCLICHSCGFSKCG
jgi:ribonucleoside-diphosphate reductase alpha chain